MRKLLMIGSILILGMTAFAGVESDLIDINAKYKGSARMTVGSRGIATDGTTTGTLIVTPTLNGGVDGNSLEFNFGDLIRNTTHTSMARFKAEVVNDKGELATLSKTGKAPGTVESFVTVGLETVTMNDGGTAAITSKNDKIDAISLKNTQNQVLGTLAYEITSKKLNNSDKTFEAEIVSTVTVNDQGNTGNFDDNSARVKIAVNFGENAPFPQQQP